MCLTVTHVPATFEDGLINRCYKQLAHDSWTNTYKTSYQGVKVPSNGWLTPPMKEVMVEMHPQEVDWRVFEGGIHFYQGDKPSGRSRTWWTYNYHNAYAFGVWGYEYSMEGVAAALYIPQCDKDKTRRRKLEKKIQRLFDEYAPLNKILKVVPPNIQNRLIMYEKRFNV